MITNPLVDFIDDLLIKDQGFRLRTVNDFGVTKLISITDQNSTDWKGMIACSKNTVLCHINTRAVSELNDSTLIKALQDDGFKDVDVSFAYAVTDTSFIVCIHGVLPESIGTVTQRSTTLTAFIMEACRRKMFYSNIVFHYRNIFEMFGVSYVELSREGPMISEQRLSRIENMVRDLKFAAMVGKSEYVPEPVREVSSNKQEADKQSQFPSSLSTIITRIPFSGHRPVQVLVKPVLSDNNTTVVYFNVDDGSLLLLRARLKPEGFITHGYAMVSAEFMEAIKNRTSLIKTILLEGNSLVTNGDNVSIISSVGAGDITLLAAWDRPDGALAEFEASVVYATAAK